MWSFFSHASLSSIEFRLIEADTYPSNIVSKRAQWECGRGLKAFCQTPDLHWAVLTKGIHRVR
jgi:hypothetical protein